MSHPVHLIATAALASPLAACVIHVDDRDTEIATIAARWSLRDMADGATTRCPSGFDTVQLFALPIDDQGTALGEPNIDLFDCDAGTGASSDLAPDLYQVWIEVRSHDLSALYAQSLSQIMDVRLADQRFTTDVLNDGGYFQLSWDLVGAASKRPLGCSQVTGLDSVLAVSTSIIDPHRIYDDRRSCADHASVSEGLLHGDYTITIAAMAGAQQVGAPITFTRQTIAAQNRVTDLGAVTIPIDGM